VVIAELVPRLGVWLDDPGSRNPSGTLSARGQQRFKEKLAGVNRRRPREKPPGRDTERLSLRLPALAGSEAAGLIGERQEGSGDGESFASSASI
jgi:hypothetical protein